MLEKISPRQRVIQAVIGSALILAIAIGTWFFLVKRPSASENRSFTVSPESGAAPLSITATYADYTFVPNTTLRFTFGDGTEVVNPPMYNSGSVNLAAVQHTYAQAGHYLVNLYVTPANEDWMYMYVKQVSVSAPKALDFSVSPSRGPAPLNVNAVYSDYDFLDFSTVSIDFGDGTQLKDIAGQNLQSVKRTVADHVYRGSGTYTVKLTVSTPSLNMERTSEKKVVVTDPESLEFTGQVINPGTRPLTVTYLWKSGDKYCSSTILPCKGLEWNYGDGTTEADAPVRPHHTYGAAGTYTVSFKYLGILTSTKQFTLSADGTIKELVAPPIVQVVSPALSKVTASAPPTQLDRDGATATRDGITIRADQTVKLTGTGTAGSTILLTTYSSPITAEIVVGTDAGGSWSYTLPRLDAGEHRVEAAVKGSSATPQVLLKLSVTAVPTTTTNSDDHSSNGSSTTTTTSTTASTSPTKTSDAASMPPSEEKKTVIVTNPVTNALAKRLVSAGSNLPFMVGVAIILASMGSYLWIVQPWHKSWNK